MRIQKRSATHPCPRGGRRRPDLGCELHFLAIQKNKRETAVSLRLINFVLQLCINN